MMIRRSTRFLMPLMLLAVAIPGTAQQGARNLGQFRADLKQFLEGMKEVHALTEESPLAPQVRGTAGIGDPGAGIDAALAAMPYLTDKDLVALHDAFQAQAGWREQPAALRALFTPEVRARLKSQGGKAGPENRAVSGATCRPGPGTPMGITDLYIAKAVALALNLVMEGFPTDGLTIAARIAPIVAYGAAETAALVLEGLNAVEAECLGARFEDLVTARLDVAVGTRASEVSLNAARTAVANVQMSVNNVQNSVNGVQTSVTNGFAATATALSNVQTSVNNVQATLNVVNAKVDALQASVNAAAERDLRLKIEANLSLPIEGTRSPVGNPARTIASFYLPASQGGHLGVARQIVDETIRRTSAAGEDVGAAPARLTAADEAIAAAKYKAAYLLLGQAYREATQSN